MNICEMTSFFRRQDSRKGTAILDPHLGGSELATMNLSPSACPAFGDE